MMRTLQILFILSEGSFRNILVKVEIVPKEGFGRSEDRVPEVARLPFPNLSQPLVFLFQNLRC